MKKIQRILAVCLALLLTAGILIPQSFAAVLGPAGEQSSQQLTTGGTTLSTAAFGSGDDTQTEHVITYQPNRDVRAMVAYGTTLYGRSTLSYTANYVNSTGERVVAGINGSFFDMSTGIPYGSVVTEGVLRTSGDVISIGFRKDGTLLIGKPGINVSVQYPNGTTSAILYNKAQSKTNGIVLYSADFDETVKSPLEQYCVILRPERAALTLGQSQRATVVSVSTQTNPEVPDGCFVLTEVTASAYSSSLTTLKSLHVGDVLTINVGCDSAWKDVLYACGAGEMLVENGKAATSFTLDSADQEADRTALGVRADGTVVLYTIDGRQEAYSKGVSLKDLAARMAELGCVTAVNLDGGGSTTMAAVTDGTLKTVNSPSDGKQRRCANFLFLVYDIGSIEAQDVTAPVMTGASVTLPITTKSPSGIVVPNPDNLSYECSSGSGKGSVYTAGMQAGTAELKITRGELETACTVQVAAPDRIVLQRADTGETVSDSMLYLSAGAVLDLTASAWAGDTQLTAQDSAFTWHCDSALGTISHDGVFTALAEETDLDGVITVSCGNVETSVSVLVAAAQTDEVTLLTGFEAGETIPSGAERCTDRSLVRFGSASLKLPYASGSGYYSCSIPMEAQQRRLGFWVYGDNSGMKLSLDIAQDGRTTVYDAGTLNFSGRKYLRLRLEEGNKTITGIQLSGGKGSGTIYLDQLTASHYVFTDLRAPEIQTSVSSGTLYVTLKDNASALTSENLIVTCDGEALAFSWSGSAAAATLPEDGAQHKIMVYASDAAGNLSSAGLTIPGTIAQPFADTSAHWAASAINYLADKKVLSGSKNASGALVYRPEDSMTRQEYIVAVVGSLGLNLDEYAAVQLPFADSAEIASWARPYCRAAYALGLLGGSMENGRRYAHPEASITRQEAMAILARTQPKGYEENDLSGFTDAGSVASWARSDIAAMVQRGVISGDGGRLNPEGTVTRAQVAQILYQMY